MSDVRTIVLLTLGLGGCAGIWTGDSGSEGSGPCLERHETVADTGAIQPGFTETPAALLAPANSSYRGSLTLESGEVVPLTVTFELNEPSVRAIYWEPAGGEDVECSAPALKADLTLRIDAGEILSGAVPCHVRASGHTLSISTYTSEPSSITTTLAPNFSRPPLASPLLITALVHQGGSWSGNWEWFGLVDCGEAELCSGIEQVPLGTVTLGNEGG